MGCPGGDTDSRRGLLVTTEAEMGGMRPRTREPGAAEDGEAERTPLWGLWEEPGTPTPDVGLSESFSVVLSLLACGTLFLRTQDTNPTGRTTRPSWVGVGKKYFRKDSPEAAGVQSSRQEEGQGHLKSMSWGEGEGPGQWS